MPTAAFTIRFGMPGDGMSVSRIRDFGEELALKMREQNLGGVGNPDTAIDGAT